MNITAITTLADSLYCQSMEEPAGLAWLEASWREPGPFWEGLLALQDSMLPGQRKSVLFQQYDFFHDLALRFAHSPAPALTRPAGNGSGASLSYAGLARRAALLADRWTNNGARPGQIAALLAFPGEALAVAVLAAFRLGLVISLLPPRGRGFVRRRLAALKPDFVLADPLLTSVLGQGPSLDWEQSAAPVGEALVSATSALYDSGSPAALLFDPCSPNGCAPRLVTADALYLGAVRDGLLALGLRPGDSYAAPGFDALQTQPCLLLAGLANGATWVHMNKESLAEDPELLRLRPLRILGLSRDVRDVLLRCPVNLGDIVRHWFRLLGETVDMEPWNRCVRLLGLKDAYASNLAWNAALGGCCLWSPRRRGLVHSQALPAAGSLWRLVQPPDGAVPALGDMGLPTFDFPSGKEEQSPGGIAPALLGRLGKLYLYSRAPHCGRNGLYYPADEVRDVAAAALPRGLTCALVTVPPSGAQDDPQRILVVFTPFEEGAKEKVDPARISVLVRQAVLEEMGPDFVPDHIAPLPLQPRFDAEGKVDGDWCAAHYLSGRLQRKARLPVFRLLARLQATVA